MILTKSQHRALKMLRDHRGPMRGTYLAELMGWGNTPQGQARLGGGYLRYLEKKGWVECGLFGPVGYPYFGGKVTKAGQTVLKESSQ